MFFKNKTKWFPLSFISLGFFVFSVSAFAQSGQDPVSSGMQWLINLIYGPIGIGICTLAVIGVGLLCLGHYLEWKRLTQTIIGVSLIFGSGAIVALIKAAIG